MKSINFEHAAQRKTYVGYVYSEGSAKLKQQILDELDPTIANLHEEGSVHIHDLEAYKQTYNCLTPDFLRHFPYEEYESNSDFRKIIGILDHFQQLSINLGNEQSGGIGFGNFDIDLEKIYENLNIKVNEINLQLLGDSIDAFMKWANDARDRCGQVQYYITFNLGLGTGELARYVTRSVLDNFRESDYIRPNIVFKVREGINLNTKDPNHDLFLLSLKTTSKKMIPTYYLADSPHNSTIDPFKMSVMGCRTKVYQNSLGPETTIGRGNIACTTINLPRIALRIVRDHAEANQIEKIDQFKSEWVEIANQVRKQLIHRYNGLIDLDYGDFPSNTENNLWFDDFTDGMKLEDIFQHGTLSIGFMGLSETIELLTGERYYANQDNYETAVDLVKFMRDTVDHYRGDDELNFSLIGTSGEFISGRFPDLDRKEFNHPIQEKGFYTNSFHVNVEEMINIFDKIEYEGSFHKFCNGGSISYVEFDSAPLSNIEAIQELINHAIVHDIHYLGFNFPMDRCRDCGYTGTFDQCNTCGSSNIQRIRRVSGYLGDLEFFTSGKQAEVPSRTVHI